MQHLTDAGQQAVQHIAARHGFSPDAVTHMLWSVWNGNGSMAQFSHWEFGGSGQWMRGGMTMIGDMFNNQLKGRVDSLCSELSQLLASRSDLVPPAPAAVTWWPAWMGSPNATGAQNNTRYAYFANSRRLAVDTGGDVWVYDTLDHQIGGFSQQQGAGGGMTFSSQYGTVNLGSLPVVLRNGQEVQAAPVAAPAPAPAYSAPAFSTPSAQASAPPAGDAGAIFAAIERLGELQAKGLLTEQEFSAKKAELLARL
ncbi:SHOCT domain-containing protein [Sphaerotilus sp.]|uniref:SHOCT domain-containing protein n=1 Tax=Sphaerotilus sp. TaxID=2093942 RepID=UPI002ACDC223|nr:SHOCT domain-containing protein [Sphaerotilus sp.]MDZ7857391.1 SHOCT domain-containing protein [Sphaerotilus sp.]